jgi:hypothetical protein
MNGLRRCAFISPLFFSKASTVVRRLLRAKARYFRRVAS